MPHRTVAGLAAEYGPIVRLKLGSVNTVAILNVKAATELFKNHDLTFVDRTITETRLRKKMDTDMKKALEIATGWVEERVEERRKEVAHRAERRKDFLDVLLDHHEGTGKDEPERMSQRDITIFLFWLSVSFLLFRIGLEIFLAGSETTSSTIEWALSELLRCPEKMTRAKDEIASVIGPNQKLEESDVENLPYLQAITKETLRLHAPIPFLVPRKAGQDTNFMGYHIPKGTQLFVNAWAIGRDPECWENPNSFEPERFLGSKVDYKGQHFELIPFGAGRRMCVGVPLAQRVLHLVLGSLLHEFDWELESHVNAATLDMKDKMGIVVRKLEPLKVIPKKVN
ncbi:cytochrome P450 76A2-like protein [Tanacetum coccineum]